MEFEILKKIGIETLGDLAMFIKEVKLPNETVEQALKRYAKELGIKEK
jgi:hypothetical protein